jgi:hypothetical protein
LKVKLGEPLQTQFTTYSGFNALHRAKRGGFSGFSAEAKCCEAALLQAQAVYGVKERAKKLLIF